MDDHGLDATFYDRYAFSPDPDDPVDRWCQLPQSGNRASVGVLLEALDLGADGRVLLDPFCGAGSTLLAGAMLGRSAIGCDLEPLAAAVSALKLAAPSLADLPDARTWARRVAGAVDGLGVRAEPVWPLVEADAAAVADAWRPADHLVTWGSAESTTEVVASFAAGRRVDVFTSPPHETGRPSPWMAPDASLLESGIAPLVRGGEARASAGGARAALTALLSALAERDLLGRVAVEYESSTAHPAAAETIAAVLTDAGLPEVEIVPLYAQPPDGVAEVLGGGLVVATS